MVQLLSVGRGSCTEQRCVMQEVLMERYYLDLGERAIALYPSTQFFLPISQRFQVLSRRLLVPPNLLFPRRYLPSLGTELLIKLFEMVTAIAQALLQSRSLNFFNCFPEVSRLFINFINQFAQNSPNCCASESTNRNYAPCNPLHQF